MARFTEKPSPAIVKAEQKAREKLMSYFRREFGLQAEMARKTGIKASFLSRLANRAEHSIPLETAILMELATNGELKAEVMCPSRADMLKQFIAGRTKSEA